MKNLHPFVKKLVEDTNTEATEVLHLAKAIDKALDEAHGYGRSVCATSLTNPQSYGEIANLSSAAFALAAIAHKNVSLLEAIHSGWSYSIIHCGEFRSSEVREEKLKLVALPFWLLSEEEQIKDVVAANAVTEWLLHK